MDSDFSIVKAGIKDLTALRKLEAECFDLDAWPLIDLIAVLVIPGMVRLKAVINGEMVGFVAGDLRRGQNLGWIITIGVLRSHRRKGIGKALLHACEDAMHIQRIRLCVRKTNLAALEMYYQDGYRHVETWKNYYTGGEDAYVLEKIPHLSR